MNVYRPLLLLGLVWQAGAAVHPPAAGEQIAIVTSSGVPAYEDVLAALRKALAREPLYVLDLREKGADQIVGDALRLKTVKVVIGIGSDAAETVMAQHPTVPVIAAATMPHALSKDNTRGRVLSVIPAQVPLPTLLDNVKRIFPTRSRLAIIRNPSLTESGVDAIKAAADAAGFVPRIVDCPGPARLLEILPSLKDQVDLVLCFPDATLYNSATIKPLVLSSLRFRLPLVGFSESFARAGAVVGVYYDFHDIGTRAAEVVLKVLNGQPVPKIEGPRKCRMAVNQNITRLLGLSYSQPAGAGEDFVILR